MLHSFNKPDGAVIKTMKSIHSADIILAPKRLLFQKLSGEDY
jgi:hypothetical protein